MAALAWVGLLAVMVAAAWSNIETKNNGSKSLLLNDAFQYGNEPWGKLFYG